MTQTVEGLLQHIRSEYISITVYRPVRYLIRLHYDYDRHISVRALNNRIQLVIADLLRA